MIEDGAEQRADSIAWRRRTEDRANRRHSRDLAIAQLRDALRCDAAQRIHRDVARLACFSESINSPCGTISAFGNRIEDWAEHDEVGARAVGRLYFGDRMRRASDEF